MGTIYLLTPTFFLFKHYIYYYNNLKNTQDKHIYEEIS